MKLKNWIIFYSIIFVTWYNRFSKKQQEIEHRIWKYNEFLKLIHSLTESFLNTSYKMFGREKTTFCWVLELSSPDLVTGCDSWGGRGRAGPGERERGGVRCQCYRGQTGSSTAHCCPRWEGSDRHWPPPRQGDSPASPPPPAGVWSRTLSSRQVGKYYGYLKVAACRSVWMIMNIIHVTLPQASTFKSRSFKRMHFHHYFLKLNISRWALKINQSSLTLCIFTIREEFYILGRC